MFGEAQTILDLLASDWGWAIVLSVSGYELFWPFWETRLQTLVRESLAPVEQKVDDVQDDVGEVRDRVETIDRLQTAHIQVTRAQARIEEDMEEDAVDEVLVDNGVDVHDFIRDDDYDDRTPAPGDD